MCWLVASSFPLRAMTILGGTISYECVNNGYYVFQLVAYRNCQDAPITSTSLTLKIWNHPIVNSLTVNRVQTEDVSLLGTNISGSTPCFNCANSAHFGVGSIERITFKSSPIELSGVPPAEGWVITFDDFSRPSNVANLQDSQNQGITLTAKIFNYTDRPNNLCVGSSPMFLQTPHFVGCVGKPFVVNLHPIEDTHADSLSVEFSHPLSKMNAGIYDPNVNPPHVVFSEGFSVLQPTPSTNANSGNQNIQLNSALGELRFLSQTSGKFNLKLTIKSFQKGQIISETMHEMVVSIVPCSGTNTPPILTAPFSGSYEKTVVVGSLVNFTLNVSDPEILPNGSPQNVTMSITSSSFGADPQLDAGCTLTPCPTLSSSLPIVGIQGANVHFNWQTSCNHLLDLYGNERDQASFHFVVRVQDDFCPIPEVVYKTLTIHIQNQGVIAPSAIRCIQGIDSTGFSIEWDAVSDPEGTFVAYEIHSVQSGLLFTTNDINTTSWSHVNVSSAQDYFVVVVSGCGGLGHARRNSDTISGIFLQVNNNNAGIAVLNWNKPHTSPLSSMHPMFYIHREYPAGTWMLIDSVPWTQNAYSEVISICDTFLHYKISVSNIPCHYLSTIAGAQFSDQTPPDIPIIQGVSIDTVTHLTTISWHAPPQSDTYGYIVYKQDVNTNFLVELDTIYGRTNTSYTYLEPYTSGSVTYTVAAFDSCPSPFGDPFNLSARDPNFHSTIYTQFHQQICDSLMMIKWNKYGGWAVESYDIFVRKNNESWILVHTSDQIEYGFLGQELQTYHLVVKANKGDGTFSFSNIIEFFVNQQGQPAYSVIRSASVHQDNKSILIDYLYDQSVPITKVELQRERNGLFHTIQELANVSSPYVFTDENVYPNEQSYTYRVLFYDSCGNVGYPSNIGRTILLKAQVEKTQMLTYIDWSAYQKFSGSVASYSIFRSINNDTAVFLSSVPAFVQSYEENVFYVNTEGKICYRIEAIESDNIFNDPQQSLSNEACVLIDPILYVPNAFSPNGKNAIFVPVLRNYQPSTYKMTILNRWGQVVFQSHDYTQGWNGKVNDTETNADSATYIYIIELDNGYGEQVVTRGHVTLLR